MVLAGNFEGKDQRKDGFWENLIESSEEEQEEEQKEQEEKQEGREKEIKDESDKYEYEQEEKEEEKMTRTTIRVENSKSEDGRPRKMLITSIFRI